MKPVRCPGNRPVNLMPVPSNSGAGVGAEVYGVDYLPCRVDVGIQIPQASFRFGNYDLNTVRIPGHTPGSIAVYPGRTMSSSCPRPRTNGPNYRERGADSAKANVSLQKLLRLTYCVKVTSESASRRRRWKATSGDTSMRYERTNLRRHTKLH